MNFETIIGLEVHAQLLTKSKMFCRCSTDYADAPPDTHVCPVCLALPGVLPTINQQAVEYTIMTALALNCTVSDYTKFDRKNYPYPDLRTPTDGESYSLVDVNRSGVPLMEVVGEPDLRSPEEARQYLIKLRSILRYLGVSTCNMEEGSFRCDANISIRPENSPELMTKVEVKNMNSFKAVYRALEYEAKRQRKAVTEDKKLTQETRGWVEETGKTVSQRSKEYAHDYRYFPEPDLPPLVLDRQWVEEIRAKLPELPDVRRDRFVTQYDLSLYDANLLTSSKAMADYFEACLRTEIPPGMPLTSRAKMAANWLSGEFSRLLNTNNIEIDDSKVSPEQFCRLLALLHQGSISGTSAKVVFEGMFNTGKEATDIIAQQGLSQISDTQEIKSVISEVLKSNAPAVADYKAGKKQSLTFLVGQVMKTTRGRANPKLVNEELTKMLEEG